MGIAENIKRIKQVVEWFPGSTLVTGRQVGKTKAIAEMIHENHDGMAVFFGFNQITCGIFGSYYEAIYPEDHQPICITTMRDLRGRKEAMWPMYVDEWFLLSDETKRQVEDHLGTIMLRIGSWS